MTEWIITSSVLIVVVVLLRQLLKGKISLRLQYALWAIVLVRLLVPITFGESKISVLNVLDQAASVVEQQEPVEEPTVSDPGWEPIGVTSNPLPSGTVVMPSVPEDPYPVISELPEPDEPSGAPTVSVAQLLTPFWLCGITVVGLWFLFTNLRFWLRLRRSRRVLALDCPIRVYVTGAAETPCLFGLIRPAVYLTPEVAEDEVALRHVLAHELTHYRHWDHVWSVLRCVCLAVHWYNPLVWLAASLSRRDAELACDESTIRRIGEEERTAYGRTLIGLTCVHRSNLLHTATTMTGSKKSIKERIVLIAKKPKMAVYTLIAVLLIAAIAVGCTFTGAERLPLVSRLEKLEEESVNLMASQLDSKFYWLSEDEYGEVIEVLRGITEDQCLEKVEYPGEFSYSLRVYADGEGWDFRLVTSEKYGDGVIGLYDDSDEDYTKAYWLWIDSPELYQYIIELFNREKAEDPEPPAFVQVTAEVYIEQQRAEVEQKYIAVSVTHEILSELKGLTRLDLGTAGLDYAVEMWRLDYDITVAINRGQDANTMAHTVYLVFLYDYINEQYTRLIGSVDDETLLSVYNTPEMLAKYGDMYRAAAMETYGQYAEASKQLDTPVSPSGGLYNLTKRGDTVSLTLHTKEGGAQRTFDLDYQSDGWKTTNLRTGISWNLLSEAPEGDWDYWLTYTSEDGTVSVTFYAGENGPVCYRDEQRTVWWTERGGTPDAETLREEVYDICQSEQELSTGFSGVGLTVKADGAKAAAEEFARVYGEALMDTYDFITDYKYTHLEVREVSKDVDALVGMFRYYVLPAGGSDAYLAEEIFTKTEDGWFYSNPAPVFLLERVGDGLWQCTAYGAYSGFTLSEFGYENGMVGAIMGNTELYRCEGDDPYEAALKLITAYVEDLMVPDDLRSFTITQYRNLTVEIEPTLEMSDAAISQYIYNLSTEEIGENTWILEFGMEYRWDGVLHDPPNGPSTGVPDDYWETVVHQGSPRGFLLTRNGNEFTLQSRY